MKSKRLNKTEVVLKHLNSYNSITRAVARRYGVEHLPDIIMRLRNRGHQINLIESGNTKYTLVKIIE